MRLSELSKLAVDEIDLLTLKQAGIVSIHALDARVIKSGEVTRKVSVRGIGVTKGAREVIEAAGGKIADAPGADDAKPAGKKADKIAAKKAAKKAKK